MCVCVLTFVNIIIMSVLQQVSKQRYVLVVAAVVFSVFSAVLDISIISKNFRIIACLPYNTHTFIIISIPFHTKFITLLTQLTRIPTILMLDISSIIVRISYKIGRTC